MRPDTHNSIFIKGSSGEPFFVPASKNHDFEFVKVERSSMISSNKCAEGVRKLSAGVGFGSHFRPIGNFLDF